MKKHINIPIFIPHLGCPNDCVFCNQRTISGRQSFDVSTVVSQIEEALSTVSQEIKCEIAFFGGSFTGIDRELMIYLLSAAKRYVDSGRVSGIRLSTRPDYIDRERLDILRSYSVSAVELGLQSMDDEVLAASKRGHTARCAEEACALIKEYGFVLGGYASSALTERVFIRRSFSEERSFAIWQSVGATCRFLMTMPYIEPRRSLTFSTVLECLASEWGFARPKIFPMRMRSTAERITVLLVSLRWANCITIGYAVCLTRWRKSREKISLSAVLAAQRQRWLGKTGAIK